MKRIYFITLMFVFAAFSLNAQITNGGFETWTGANPDGWGGSKTATTNLTVTKVTTNVHGGTNALGLTNTQTGTSHRRYTSTATTVTNGTSYEISFWVRGTGQIRTGMYTGINAGTSGYLAYNPYVAVTSTWTQVTQTLVADGSVSVAEFILSIYDGSDVVVDDVVVTGGATTPQANIVTFSFAEQASAATINTSAGTVAIQVVNGTSLTSLVPTITVSPGATINPASGVAQDYTNPVGYVVTASDASTKNWTVTVTVAGVVTVTPIYDIQYTTTAPYDSPLNNQVVTTRGIVTAVHSAGYFIQDGTTPWNGLYVYDNTHTPALGDDITLTGTVAEYYNYTELKTITSFITNSTGNALPTPIVLTNSAVKSEQYEGMLVKVVDDKCTYVHTTGWWKVAQGTDTLEIGKLIFPFPGAVLNTQYDVTGLVNYSFSAFKVEPRDANDIQIHSGINELNVSSVVIYPNPANDFIYLNNANGFVKAEITDISGRTIFSQNLNANSEKINVSDLNKGTYFVRLINQNNEAVVKTIVKN